ncbi:unnamed protein product [Urochloa decumbens]|uniref:Knottins-like domain-containing protein n=1 Tax=Urochloa decumbens TaxID=240449 RepID=A0ABC9AZ97_9POAL
MAPSPRKNVSAAITVLLLLVIVTAETAPIPVCQRLSGKQQGWCLHSDICDRGCRNEINKNNIGGKCTDFPPRCYCYYKCAP